ncbi:MAG: 16S rRNA (uracil(1498)-N(3))-methyltransferase [Gammaproteobacteria bacterium]|nr:16S rRNA (uracil(1498)-N(3))-methyltransferase [Gammaproteobacteria bacterium]
MRVPRIYTDQALSIDRSISLEIGASHHLSRVIRLKPGDAIKLFNGNGEEYAGKISSSHKHGLCVDIDKRLRKEPAALLAIDLLIGISRGERMDYALQKAVELGVSNLRPVFTKRCMVKLEGKRLQQRMDHWRNILINACEQSGRCRVPELRPAINLPESLAHVSRSTGLLLHHLSDKTLWDLHRPQDALAILVGPEGGLADEERRLAIQSGFTAVRLGPRIMRTETAPLAAIAAIQALWGDFRS